MGNSYNCGQQVDYDNDNQANRNPDGTVNILTGSPVDVCFAADGGVVVAEFDSIRKSHHLSGR